MSYTSSITNELIRDKSLKANTKILLLVLMTYENKEGFAYPSQPRLIEETGLSKNTLLKCLNELEEKGYIKRVKENGVNNKYYINRDIKIDTGTGIKINTGSSIKINTLEVLNTSNKKEKENKKSNIDKIIEAYTQNDLLVEAIRDFIKMRSTIKKPLTDRALKGILNKLDTFAVNDLDKVEILENSIMNCWQSVFELKNKKAPVGAGTQKNNLVNPNICNPRRKYTQSCDVG